MRAHKLAQYASTESSDKGEKVWWTLGQNFFMGKDTKIWLIQSNSIQEDMGPAMGASARCLVAKCRCHDTISIKSAFPFGGEQCAIWFGVQLSTRFKPKQCRLRHTDHPDQEAEIFPNQQRFRQRRRTGSEATSFRRQSRMNLPQDWGRLRGGKMQKKRYQAGIEHGPNDNKPLDRAPSP